VSGLDTQLLIDDFLNCDRYNGYALVNLGPDLGMKAGRNRAVPVWPRSRRFAVGDARHNSLNKANVPVRRATIGVCAHP